ncbi:DMT family transporter [Nocardioides faecalis]|uniref:DMT family transporter n=1 Tax=Nocardioides faecalis TaxID=2803858 RepID=UPI0027DC1C2D|nr:DMT family transporter [Nocardioides faecalis]
MAVIPAATSGATSPSRVSPGRAPAAGLAWGLLGVLAFSFTLPLTRVAVEGLSPLFLGSARAAVAAVLAAACLAATRQRSPSRRQWARLTLVGAGVVLGFPFLTSYALQTSSAGHGAMVIAVLPAATAVLTVLRTRERPRTAFWVAAGAGAVAAVGFASVQPGGAGGLGVPQVSDLLLFGAVLAAALGYAEGGLLARELGAWQTVCWALLLCAPITATLTAVAVAQETPHASATQWASFAYLGAVSMFLAFFAWYRGLAIGPMAQVSQVQLVQPMLTFVWAALLLGEQLTGATLLGGALVIACAAGAVRVRLSSRPPAAPPA